MMEVNGINMLIGRLVEIARSVDHGESLLRIPKESVLVVGGRKNEETTSIHIRS